MGTQARRDQQDREVEVNRDRLLETLKQNRENHLKQYQDAVAGYREAATEKLEKAKATALEKMERNFDKVKMDIDAFEPGKTTNDFITLIQAEKVHLPAPKNFVKEYDAAIDIAKWEINETMKLTFAEFQCFVRDEWEWTQEFVSNSTMYVKH